MAGGVHGSPWGWVYMDVYVYGWRLGLNLFKWMLMMLMAGLPHFMSRNPNEAMDFEGYLGLRHSDMVSW